MNVFLCCFGAFSLTLCRFASSQMIQNPTSKNNSKGQIEDYFSERLLNFDLEETYVLYYNNFDLYVTDIKTNEKIYVENTSYPFNKNDDSLHIYNHYFGNSSRFLCSDGEYLWEPNYPDYRIGFDEAFFGVSDFSDEESIDSIPSYANAITNSEYFLRLADNHGHNGTAICGLVSLQILCGYFDVFYSDSFIPEKWDRLAVESISSPINWNDWSKMPGGGLDSDQINDSRMIHHLLDYVTSFNPLVEFTGMSFLQQKRVLSHYLNEQSIGYSFAYSEGNPVDCNNNYSKTIIKQAIDNNYPVIANGSRHSTVAFAYDDDYVYVHTGWGFCTRSEWSVFTSYDATFTPSAIYLIPSQTTHSHSNNFYSSATNCFYCSCGLLLGSRVANNSYLAFPTTPTPTPDSFSYNSGFNAIFTFSNSYKNLYNEIIIKEYGYIIISMTTPIHAVTLEAHASFDTEYNPNCEINYIDSTGSIIYSYLLSEYTELRFLSSTDLVISLNCPQNVKKIAIKVNGSPFNPTNNKLSIKKLVLSIC